MNVQEQFQRARRIASESYGQLSLQFKLGIAITACLVVLAGAYYVYLFASAQPQTVGGKPAGSVLNKGGAKQPNPLPVKNNGSANGASNINQGTPKADPQSTPNVLPASILDLSEWKLTLPIGKTHDPDEITQPQLADYVLAPYFQANTAKSGVQFQAPVGGVTTSGSKFARSELREMTSNGQKEASWSTTSGISTLTLSESVDHLPVKRPEVVAAQIHGPSAYVILVRLNGSRLFVEGSGGKDLGALDPNYKLGTEYSLQITVQGGHILVSYNGAQKVDYANSGSGDYFKAGCYTQSNPSYGDAPSSYGQTTIYRLSVSHS